MLPTISATEEDYLKAIYKIAEEQVDDVFVNTNAIAARMNTKAASVTDMIKRLSEKELISYQKYKGVQLTNNGNIIAKSLVRKHRLWEVFLTNKLGYKWDEVHDIAEQLEHIQSVDLIDRLDDFLDNPRFDPHGDPIPDKEGNFVQIMELLLADLSENDSCSVLGIKDHSNAFLRYLEEQQLVLGAILTIIKIHNYDQSVTIKLGASGIVFTISNQVSQNLYVKKISN